MEFEKCKQCKCFRETLAVDYVENFCCHGKYPKPIELVEDCDHFDERKSPIWEAIPVGKRYGVAKLYGIDDIDRLTCLSPNGDGTRDLWFSTRDRAEIVAAALNQEIFARQIEREIEERGREKMNKKKALKILEGLKEIQDECRRVGDCTECEFYLDGRYSENCLFDWNLDGDYEFKTASCQNLEYSHPSLYNRNYTYDVPNHRHEDSAPDMIHHPGHYNFRGMECKDFIEKFVSDPKSYYEGNIFKYLYRYLEKNKEEDLNKAMEYTRLLKEYMYGKKD